MGGNGGKIWRNGVCKSKGACPDCRVSSVSTSAFPETDLAIVYSDDVDSTGLIWVEVQPGHKYI